MKSTLLILFGWGLILIFPGKMAIIIAAGMVAGFVYLLAERKWPQETRATSNSFNRPKPTTPASSYVLAAALAVGAAGAGVLIGTLGMPRVPLVAMLGIYLAAAGVGASLVIALTAKRSSERHNARIAAATPLEPLDF